MKTYNNLPTLVTAKILAFAFSGADGDIAIWKQALSLLSVCHGWRVQGVNTLYRYAIVKVVDPNLIMDDSDEEESDYSDEEAVTDSGGSDWESVSSSINCISDAFALDGGDPIRVYTNIKLIEKLGLESMVKQLLFSEKQPQVLTINEFDSMGAFISILEALFQDLPGNGKLTEPFNEWFDLEYMDAVSDNQAEGECYAVIKAATDAFINKYPNISSINAVMINPHEFMQKMIVELAVGYDKQLTKFVCAMPATFSYTLLAPNLADLDLRLGCSIDDNLPTIFPQSLRTIQFMLDDQPFNWDVFRVDKKSKTIAFDNLVYLSLTGTIQDSDAGNEITNNLNLSFPKLERLFLENISLTTNEAQAMIGHGLKWLYCEGSIIAASQLCKQPLRDLDTLFLIWVEEEYPDEVDDFVFLANEIFNKTDDIKYVHCEIRAANFDDSMLGIYWTYLTHLSLGFTILFEDLFEIVQNVPNLLELNMVIDYHDVNVITEATEFLTNIKKHYPTPSSSKIETLRIVIECATLCSNPCCQSPFGKAVQNLRWYWPQLKNIDIQN
ncbi:hypothetical protein J3B01_004094 [Coemansia erecta]|nr:hypothetical protein J3B01_004094 [Coemansia erecta]